MQGLILMELREFVLRNLPTGSWEQMLESCGLEGRVYGMGDYPDGDVSALAGAAARIAAVSTAEILERFGEFIVPALMGGFKPFIDPKWRTLDLLLNTEKTIHRAVRIRDASAMPPALVVSEAGTDTVMIRYASPRQLCSLAKGIVRGVAVNYGERVSLEELRCMHRGDPACEISVRLEKAPFPGLPFS